MRRGILPIVGRKIVAIERPRCRKKPILVEPPLVSFRRRVVGRTVSAVERIGKRVVIRVAQPKGAEPDAIVIEPRMTGLVLLAEPPTREHLRLRLLLDGAPGELLFWDRR